MPYSSITRPSLALGLIERYIQEYGHDVDVIYANVEFAKELGLAAYDSIDNSFFEHLFGEWTYSRAAFPEMDFDDDGFFSLFSDINDDIKQQLFNARNKAETYLEQLAQRLLQKSPKVIACTSTFQQNCASLALLRKVKKIKPDIITMMGGANCEGIMGQTLSEYFPWLDYVFSGECDDVIGEFIDSLIHGESISAQQLPYGFISQKKDNLCIVDVGANKQVPRGYIDDMSQVSSPIFGRYFDTIKQLGLNKNIEPGLLAETSRGCWWGAKKHCTFCGLNGVSMTHRSKNPETVIEEFKLLSTKYNINKFEIVDNIFPVEYTKTVLPLLSKEPPYNIFYETKANLKKDNIEQMASAGIKWIQPGFESLHDDFLKLVAKGTTAIQNISALKWCRNFGVRVSWNLLCGAPYEKDHWYDEMAKVIPLISHLQPPFHELIKIRFPRFSPYFKTPEKYGLVLEPLKTYQYIYPLNGQSLFNIAYFFDHQNAKKKTGVFSLQENSTYQNESHKTLQIEITQWVDLWENVSIPLLYMSDQGEKLVIIDTRQVATSFTHQLTGASAIVYRLCAEPISVSRLSAKLAGMEQQLEQSDLDGILMELVNNKLLLFLSNCYLALALVGKTPVLPEEKDYPAGYLKLD